MPSDLYDRDFVTWSFDQAEKLRRLSQGEQVNDIDWPHVIEEVGDLGKTETRQVRSLLIRALEHLLKVIAFPNGLDTGAWLQEADTFLRDAKLAWFPGMDQLIDVPELYELAIRGLRRLSYREGPAEALPQNCPWTLRDLLPLGKAVTTADADELLEKLRAAR